MSETEADWWIDFQKICKLISIHIFNIILDHCATEADSIWSMAVSDAFLIHAIYYTVLVTVSLCNLDISVGGSSAELSLQTEDV
jgi:hypothetical protein